MSTTKKYEEAVARLEEIVARMESDQTDLDQLATLLREAQALITLCRDRLTKTDEEIARIVRSEE